MITASDVHKRLKDLTQCEGVDDWIESVLIPKFTEKHTVRISDRDIKWKKESFIVSMRLRGFLVEYYCEDRPCGGCWYKIILPPGEE